MTEENKKNECQLTLKAKKVGNNLEYAEEVEGDIDVLFVTVREILKTESELRNVLYNSLVFSLASNPKALIRFKKDVKNMQPVINKSIENYRNN